MHELKVPLLGTLLTTALSLMHTTCMLPATTDIFLCLLTRQRHPFIFWPGFGTSRLRADVEDQDLEPDCPASGTFHTAFGNPSL